MGRSRRPHRRARRPPHRPDAAGGGAAGPARTGGRPRCQPRRGARRGLAGWPPADGERGRPAHHLPAREARRPAADRDGARRRVRDPPVKRWTLRTQIALAAAGSILLGVILLGAALQVLLARDLHHQLDRTLRQRATDVATLGATTPALLRSPGSLDSTATSGTILIQVYDGRGRIYARSQSLGAGVMPASALAHRVIRDGHPRYADARFGTEAIRVYAAPLSSLGGGTASGGAVVIASSTEQVDHTLSELRTLTLLAGLVAALLAVPAAMLLTRRALRPLERLSADAAGIQRTGDPAQRVSHPEGPQEIAALASALNGMLAALERARDSERRFLADASHELRTPLTALRGNAAYLARHSADGEVFADLEADAERLAGLAHDPLTPSRGGAGRAPTPAPRPR